MQFGKKESLGQANSIDITNRQRQTALTEQKKEEAKKAEKSFDYNYKPRRNLVDPSSILQHQKEIDAIMIAIKPSISHYFCKSYNKDMIKRYIRKSRDDVLIKRRIESKIQNLMKLGIKPEEKKISLFAKLFGNMKSDKDVVS